MIEEANKRESRRKEQKRKGEAMITDDFQVKLDSTKQRLIYELATKSNNGKPTGGENESPAGTSFGGKYDKANK